MGGMWVLLLLLFTVSAEAQPNPNPNNPRRGAAQQSTFPPAVQLSTGGLSAPVSTANEFLAALANAQVTEVVLLNDIMSIDFRK